MLPLRDRNPSGIVPKIVYVLVAVNVLVFLYEMSLDPESVPGLFSTYGLVPARVTAALRGDGSLVRWLIIPAFTSMFLHGSIMHLLGNMWYLWVFGDNVEGRLGHAGFAVFYLVCGLVAGAAQYVLDTGSPVPTIGASGAVAGMLGAYAICWPRARVLTLVPLFVFITIIEIPAMFVLGFWFVIQFLQGVADLGAGFAHGGVAHAAHVGGFAFGALVIKLLPRRGKPARPRRY